MRGTAMPSQKAADPAGTLHLVVAGLPFICRFSFLSLSVLYFNFFYL